MNVRDVQCTLCNEYDQRRRFTVTVPSIHFIFWTGFIGLYAATQPASYTLNSQHQLNSIFIISCARFSIDRSSHRSLCCYFCSYLQYIFYPPFEQCRNVSLRNAITKHVIICSIKTYTLRIYRAFIHISFIYGCCRTIKSRTITITSQPDSKPNTKWISNEYVGGVK